MPFIYNTYTTKIYKYEFARVGGQGWGKKCVSCAFNREGRKGYRKETLLNNKWSRDTSYNRNDERMQSPRVSHPRFRGENWWKWLKIKGQSRVNRRKRSDGGGGTALQVQKMASKSLSHIDFSSGTFGGGGVNLTPAEIYPRRKSERAGNPASVAKTRPDETEEQ